MFLRTLVGFRKTVKDPNSLKNLLLKIEKEINENDKIHKTRNKELQDLKSIVLKSKEIIDAETPV